MHKEGLQSAAVTSVFSPMNGAMERRAAEIIDAFLGARFSGDARHVRRLAKVTDLEDRFGSDTG